MSDQSALFICIKKQIGSQFESLMDEEPQTAMIPEGHCPCCMKPAELIRVEISYPYSWRQTFLCIDCKDKVVIAISKALESVGLH